LAFAFIATLTFLLLCLPFLMGVVMMMGLTRPPCGLGSTPAAFAPRFESVTITSTNGLQVEGYFLPGANGATVITVPAFNAGRGGQLEDAAVFNTAGFNVLTLNSRVCTELGWFSLGYYEVEDVLAARDYLLTRPDVDADRIGLHGFSSGGATALMTAQRAAGFRSVSAMGGYHDYAIELGLGQTTDFFSALFQWGVAGGYRLFTGNDITRLSPYNGLDQLVETSVLLIYGSTEPTLTGAQKMQARGQALGLNIDLWVVEGAGHGNYHVLEPVEYARRLTAFHGQAAGVGS
jgi:dipeptidyl aminopeptidase/acylaminoacyl peptidase